MSRKSNCSSLAIVTHTLYSPAGVPFLERFLQRPAYTVVLPIDAVSPWTPGEARTSVSEYRAVSHSLYNTANDCRKTFRDFMATCSPTILCGVDVRVVYENRIPCAEHRDCCHTQLHRETKSRDAACWCSQNLAVV